MKRQLQGSHLRRSVEPVRMGLRNLYFKDIPEVCEAGNTKSYCALKETSFWELSQGHPASGEGGPSCKSLSLLRGAPAAGGGMHSACHVG